MTLKSSSSSSDYFFSNTFFPRSLSISPQTSVPAKVQNYQDTLSTTFLIWRFITKSDRSLNSLPNLNVSAGGGQRLIISS
jgi:hypothetical protein